MDVVWLASYPRSGVTFLRHVLEELYGLPTFSRNPERTAAVAGILSDKRHWPKDADGSLPVHFVKTHGTRVAGTRCPAIHLVRDGRDVAVSYACFMRDFQRSPKTFYDACNEILHGDCEYGDWATHTLAWAGRPAARIRFNDLIANPAETVAAAVESLDLGLPRKDNPQVKTFGELQAGNSDFFRSGQVGEWKTTIPTHLLAFVQMQWGGALDWFAELANGE